METDSLHPDEADPSFGDSEMLTMTLLLEDQALIGRSTSTGDWLVQLSDSFSGKSASALWSGTQLAAVCALANGVEEHGILDEATIANLKAIAEHCFANLPIELRIIP